PAPSRLYSRPQPRADRGEHGSEVPLRESRQNQEQGASGPVDRESPRRAGGHDPLEAEDRQRVHLDQAPDIRDGAGSGGRSPRKASRAEPRPWPQQGEQAFLPSPESRIADDGLYGPRFEWPRRARALLRERARGTD